MNKRNLPTQCKSPKTEQSLITEQNLITKQGLISDSSQLAAKRVNAKKCTCRYLWNNELHGLTALLKSRTLSSRFIWGSVIAVCFLMSLMTSRQVVAYYLERQTATLNSIKQPNPPGLKLPVIVLCPKNPDSLNLSQIQMDINKRLPLLNDGTLIKQLIRFAVAGAGFSNVGRFMPTKSKMPNKTSDTETEHLGSLLHRWRGNRTLSDFYKNIFEDWGYKCHEFIQKCFIGYQFIANCCTYFEPYFVMLRGRCLRMNRPFHQNDPADIGRIDVYMNQMPSRLSDSTSKKQPQVIAYLTDNDRNVGLFPRYYIHFRTSVMLRVRARKIIMLPGNSQCQNGQKKDSGRNTCWLKRWLDEKVISPYNCTLFYLNFGNHTICDPTIIVKNYEKIIDLRLKNREGCLPPCKRYEHVFKQFNLKASIINQHNFVPPFRMEVSFTNLELELYREVPTITFPDFISQLGGQSGLYVGLSVCSLVQIFISFVWKCHLWIKCQLEDRQRMANFRKRLPLQ